MNICYPSMAKATVTTRVGVKRNPENWTGVSFSKINESIEQA